MTTRRRSDLSFMVPANQGAPAVRRRQKYGAEPTKVDGIRFASKAEARRWQELRLLERAGEITDIERQPRFPLSVNGQRIGDYVGDFRYRWVRDGQITTEDVKGVATPLYQWKKRHVEAQYGITVVEIRRTR